MNSIKILREYIETVLAERSRPKSGARFNINKFKSFEDYVDAYAYAVQTLEYIAHGSSRVAFILSSSKVLKIANPDGFEKGRGQNEAEMKTYQNLKAKHVVSKVFDHDDNFNWLISELVRPVDDENEFNIALDLDEELSFEDLLVLAEKYGTHYTRVLQEENVSLSEKAHKFVLGLVELLHIHDVLSADMGKLSSWGKTADGRIVLLDYGYNMDVALKHYRPDLA